MLGFVLKQMVRPETVIEKSMREKVTEISFKQLQKVTESDGEGNRAFRVR